MGKTINAAPELYEQRSPRYLADQIKVPLLILHGEKDQVVNVKEILWLVEALRNAGNPQFESWLSPGALGARIRIGQGVSGPPSAGALISKSCCRVIDSQINR